MKRGLGKKCLVFIWKDRADYLRHVCALGRPDLAVSGGFAVSAVDRIPHQLYLYNSDYLFGTVIPHELGHLVLEVSLNPSRRYRVPLWLHEGFAQCQEEKSFAPVAEELRVKAEEQDLLPLCELTGYKQYPASPEKRKLFYLARKMVFWSEDLEDAIRTKYDKQFSNLNQLEELWIKYLKSYAGGGE